MIAVCVRYEQASDLDHCHRLAFHHRRPCCAHLPPATSAHRRTQSTRIGRTWTRLGFSYPCSCHRRRVVHAQGPELGTLAVSGVDGLPFRPEFFPRSEAGGRPWIVVLRPPLLPISLPISGVL